MQKEILAIFFRGRFWRLRTKPWAGFMSVAIKDSKGGGGKNYKSPVSPGPPCSSYISYTLVVIIWVNEYTQLTPFYFFVVVLDLGNFFWRDIFFIEMVY